MPTDFLGYRFQSPDLLRTALTHSSAAVSVGKHNQRLEFLGDAILGLVISAELYEKFPAATEGRLSELKAGLVSRAAMARALRRQNWREFILLGRGVGDGDLPDSIYANVGEALIAAVYLDSGCAWEPTRNFIFALLRDELTAVNETSTPVNYKAALQKRAQGRGEIQYRLLRRFGSQHQPLFRVGAFIGEELAGQGDAATKKAAEHAAARNALKQFTINN
ncbi:ribonuclease 3 [Planctomycetales bacterium]|nr:ribonuclease 3 [Planctomycetales bacterium]GHS98151.1 ribonuclease 3 [Planctomycetales bacterium]GHT05337.1 ribonuclease 3 [Planctomycetales bacterium]